MAKTRKAMSATKWTGDALRKLRKDYGKCVGRTTPETQTELALRLGVDVTSVQFWEQDRGAPSLPVCYLLDRLAEDLKAGKIRDLQPA